MSRLGKYGFGEADPRGHAYVTGETWIQTAPSGGSEETSFGKAAEAVRDGAGRLASGAASTAGEAWEGLSGLFGRRPVAAFLIGFGLAMAFESRQGTRH